MAKIVKTITIEWECGEDGYIPEVFASLVEDGRCLSFAVKQAVTQKEYYAFVKEKAKDLAAHYRIYKDNAMLATEDAEKFVEMYYYIG